ncbi:hypothetical protein PUN28_000333 [Cardiocondyla obscurior]|uniref:Uncharacterized protein n=1 Tax=Cardiocondyla obscurior TaxID=286306 RepID=A0AAW2GYX0_9HYME
MEKEKYNDKIVDRRKELQRIIDGSTEKRHLMGEKTSTKLVLFLNEARPREYEKRGKEGGKSWEQTSEKRSRSAPGIGMIELSDLPWQLRTTSCQMMGRVLINNTGSDWLPAGGSRVRYTESREQ